MGKASRALVCGGRDYRDGEHLWNFLDGAGITFLIVGYDPNDKRFQGADQLAYEWAQMRGIPGRCFPAEWGKYRKAAGPIRNQKMIDRGKPEVVYAAPGGVGTADMKAKAKAACIEVIETTP